VICLNLSDGRTVNSIPSAVPYLSITCQLAVDYVLLFSESCEKYSSVLKIESSRYYYLYEYVLPLNVFLKKGGRERAIPK
jgi:hypothetical protein